MNQDTQDLIKKRDAKLTRLKFTPSAAPRTLVDGWFADITKQQVFDRVVAFLVLQGKQSRGTESGVPYCMYRGTSKSMCAAGCLLPDAFYDRKAQEGVDFYGVLRRIERSTIPGARDWVKMVLPFRDLIQKLQEAHDAFNRKVSAHPDFLSAFLHEAALLAQAYDLQMDPFMYRQLLDA
ncbi:hypothetical protein [Ralstonia phage phiRSL1]|uniref:Uncharacterized protein n=1 Tax=Ralstonia phage phiRSL1 TaxID=1980924 RepID=B2ZXP5_9CAUD|nr:hypothetical protein RSL1_ORF025 [Ralstonia phage phiRSL1]BAG41470.1 hypothetical protein [Ralstonia phage phiRSL1]